MISKSRILVTTKKKIVFIFQLAITMISKRIITNIEIARFLKYLQTLRITNLSWFEKVTQSLVFHQFHNILCFFSTRTSY